MLICKHRTCQLEWVHIRCVDIRMKSFRICNICKEPVHDGQEIVTNIGGSSMGLRHVWCARRAAEEWGIIYPDPIPQALNEVPDQNEPDVARDASLLHDHPMMDASHLTPVSGLQPSTPVRGGYHAPMEEVSPDSVTAAAGELAGNRKKRKLGI